MTFITFVQVFTICLLGAMSPGPSMAVVINNAVFKNRTSGYITSIGHAIGITLYAIFAVLSLNFIIKSNFIFFNFLEIIFILVLFYFGINSFNSKTFSKKDLDIGRKNINSFIQGLSIAILNPKIFIWFTVIYSQFIKIDQSYWYYTILILTAGIIDACWYVFLSRLVSSNIMINKLETRLPLLKKIIGIFFFLFGVYFLINYIF